MNTIKNLVFEGGGVKGVAYTGALQVLEEKGILQQIERVAGTSAGAIVSILVSMKVPVPKLSKIVKDLDLASFQDKQNIFKKFKFYGLHPGDAFLNWLKKVVEGEGVDPMATFEDFRRLGFHDLHVFSSDIYAHKVQEFSIKTTPKTIVIEAVRASMSIPLFFNAWQFSNKIPNDHLFVDGGMVFNYPITAFDNDPSGKANPETLGFRLEDVHAKKIDNEFGYGHLLDYVKNTFETLMRSQTIMYMRDPDQVKRTVVIDDHGIPATDFDITEQQKDLLIQSGKEATEAHFGAA